MALADRVDAPYYRRRFVAAETDEVRVYLHGGDDRVERTGPAAGRLTVRVIAGGGHDVIDDSKGGGTDVWRDAGTMDVSRGPGTTVRNEVWPNPVPVKDAPWIEPRSYGNWTVRDAGVRLRAGPLRLPGLRLHQRTSWGFRTEPAKSVQTLRGAITTGDTSGKLEYLGTFRRPASGLGYQLSAFASGIEAYNYFGYGNESAGTDDRARYKTRENVFFCHADAALRSGPARRLRSSARRSATRRPRPTAARSWPTRRRSASATSGSWPFARA